MNAISSDPIPQTAAIAFAGDERVAFGDIRTVAAAVKEQADRRPSATVIVFDAVTSERIELDLRGTVEDVLRRLAPPPGTTDARAAGPVVGRPRLGVVAREVTLLPRHWEWLGQQPGGASVALRKLVDIARHAGAGNDRVRQAQEAAYRFLTVMAGDRPGYEEVIRALYARDRDRFSALVEPWPADVRAHAFDLAVPAFTEAAE